MSPAFALKIFIALPVLWNILLAAFPCLLAHELWNWSAKKKWKQMARANRLLFLAAFMMWFLLFPNTTYLFTMGRYLVGYCSNYTIDHVCLKESWMVMAFFVYALIGLPAFVYALEKMTAVLSRIFSKDWYHYFPVFMIPITALGLLFGLFERLNSWDVFTRPLFVLQAGATYFTNGHKLFNLVIYTLGLFVIYYGTDYLWKRHKK